MPANIDPNQAITKAAGENDFLKVVTAEQYPSLVLSSLPVLGVMFTELSL